MEIAFGRLLLVSTKIKRGLVPTQNIPGHVYLAGSPTQFNGSYSWVRGHTAQSYAGGIFDRGQNSVFTTWLLTAYFVLIQEPFWEHCYSI